MVIHTYTDKQTQMNGPGQGPECWEWKWGNVSEGLQEVAVTEEVGRRSRVRAFRFLVRKIEYGLGKGLPASPWPGTSQVLPTPGGRDSGRLGLSVRTWLAEAATAADLKGGSGGASPPQEKKFKVVFGCLNLGETL